MMNKLQEEQLRIHFGDEYETVKGQTVRFITSILRGSLRPLADRIRNNEGGMGQLIVNALLTIAEKGELDAGLRAYASQLEEEYNYNNNRSSTHHTKWYGLGDNVESIELRLEEEASQPLVGLPPHASGDLQPLSPHVEQLVSDKDEQELFQLLGDLGASHANSVGRSKSYGLLKEAFKILEWDEGYGMKVYHRVKKRAARD